MSHAGDVILEITRWYLTDFHGNRFLKESDMSIMLQLVGGGIRANSLPIEYENQDVINWFPVKSNKFFLSFRSSRKVSVKYRKCAKPHFCNRLPLAFEKSTIFCGATSMNCRQFLPKMFNICTNFCVCLVRAQK